MAFSVAFLVTSLWLVWLGLGLVAWAWLQPTCMWFAGDSHFYPGVSSGDIVRCSFGACLFLDVSSSDIVTF